MKDDWVEISFGIEDINNYKRWIYDEWLDKGGTNPAITIGEFGEVNSRHACLQAIKDNRIFHYRIRYEPK